MNLAEILRDMYERDLDKLAVEIEAFGNEKDLWLVSGAVSNSAGNLCLHICGNLLHFIAATLGESGYIRDRDSEFARKDVPREELLAEIAATRDVVARTLSNLTAEKLNENYPVEVFGHPMTTAWFLTHLATHLNYHLGQINYHRRLLAS
ncbi:MAG: DinB family protein [Blastocatellia bacterium]|nr:DinB family protein [Blastocatellia bacterium]